MKKSKRKIYEVCGKLMIKYPGDLKIDFKFIRHGLHDYEIVIKKKPNE